MVLGAGILGTACGSRGRETAAGTPPARFGFGRAATTAEINAWDIDVTPDGTGLPAGSGTARAGSAVYARKCAACHGRSGTEGPMDRLAGREPRQGFPFGRDRRFVPTIGNYWPYATTIYDYVNRAMPLNAPGSLEPDEVYGLVAWLLWRNEIISDTTVIDRHSLPRIVMPARSRFVPDDRKGGPEVR
jgi:cytochrome c